MSNKTVQATLAAIAVASAALVTPAAFAQSDPNSNFPDTPQRVQQPVQQQVQPQYQPQIQPQYQPRGQQQYQQQAPNGVYVDPRDQGAYGQQQANQFTQVPRFVQVPGDAVGMQWDSARDCLVRGGGFVFNMKTRNWDQGYVSAGNSVNVDGRGNTDCAVGRAPVDVKALYKNLGYTPPQAADWFRTAFPGIRNTRLQGMRVAEQYGALSVTADSVTTAYANDVSMQPQRGACVKTINGKQVWENPCVTRNGSVVPGF